MEVLITRSIEALLLPPGGIILLIALGLLLSRRHTRTALSLLMLGLFSLYALSIPVTQQALMQMLETYPALYPKDLRDSRAQAIVVLGAGRYSSAPEYLGDTVSDYGLVRLRYAVRLHKQTGLPLLLTGGDPLREGSPEALLMQEVLLDDFHVKADWTEQQSNTTAENAFFTQALLKEQGITRIYLVTHAWHMPRAVKIFEQAGLEITPAPTRFHTQSAQANRGLLDWLPHAGALNDSNIALHEILGNLWYQIRY